MTCSNIYILLWIWHDQEIKVNFFCKCTETNIIQFLYANFYVWRVFPGLKKTNNAVSTGPEVIQAISISCLFRFEGCGQFSGGFVRPYPLNFITSLLVYLIRWKYVFGFIFRIVFLQFNQSKSKCLKYCKTMSSVFITHTPHLALIPFQCRHNLQSI